VIVSVSRRCDIPRFQFDWFMERLHEGFVDVVNPFNAAQVKRVSLLPDDVDFFVFWTRDPRAICERAEELEKRGCRFYVMVTVTGYPSVLEPNVPPAETVCAAMRELAQKTGTRRVIWRYDPVFLSSVTGGDFHRNNFSALARRLEGPVSRVIISLYDEYRNARRRLEALEKSGALAMTHNEDVNEVLAAIAETAAAAGMEIQSCAEAENFAAFGIRPGACIDKNLAAELWNIEPAGKAKHQRPYCLCAQSVDIGRYGNCPAGCVYCYAS
jgi:DNA repair photolyase